MRSFFIFFVFVLINVSVMAQATHISNAHVGVFYPVSTNGRQAATYSNRFSFNLFQGLSGSETGFTLSGLVSNIRDSANGVQIASLVNTIGGKSNGVQIAGLANVGHGPAQGVQIAGLLNTAKTMNGIGLAGLANISHGDSKGLQVAGLVNRSGNVNTQIGGLVNIAKKVKGVQIAGLVNIADSSDYPIGLINIIHNGDMSVGVSVDQSLTTLATFRSGGARLYGILGAGYNLKHADRNLYALQGGIGAHLIYTPVFKLNAEVTTLTLADFKGAYNTQSGLLVYPTLRVWRRMEVFAGPSISYTMYRRDKADVNHHYLWSDTNSRGKEGLFVGAVAGLQWTL